MKLIRWFEDRFFKKLKKKTTKAWPEAKNNECGQESFVHSDSIQFSSFQTYHKKWTKIQPKFNKTQFSIEDSCTPLPIHLKPFPTRQRSLIKTNPWLPSPWFNRENSHCSRSSSSSDSLCHVRDHSSNENIYSKNGLQAQINLNPGLNFHHNLTKFESSNDEPLTTSDEDSQSYSSNIYSSCSNVTKEYDSSVNQALTRFELNKVKEKHFSSQYYNLLSQYLYKKKKRFQPHYSKLVRYPYPSVYKNYSKSNFEEKWVHTVTDLISLASFENELDQLDLILENNDRDIPSPNLKHPSFHFDYNQYTQNSFHPSSSTNSEITFNDQLSQTSPLTADSGYDISEISENDSQCLEEPSTLMYPNICSTEILKSKIQNVKREMNNSIQYEQLRQKQWDILNQIIV